MATELANLILARIRSRGDRAIRLSHLVGLSDRDTRHRRERHIDQLLQRMRRSGTIRYDAARGWLEVVAQAEETKP